MKEKGKVTIVIPVYNAEKYLHKCVSSIQCQTYKNLEIILIDDGSKDKSPQICDELQKLDERIRVVHKKNEGAGKSRNRGINLATGDYIFFVDSDDYIKNTLVETCLNAIDNELASMVMFGIEDVDEQENKIGEKVPYTDKKVFKGDEITNHVLPELLFSPTKNIRNLETPASMAHFYTMDIIKKNGWQFVSEKEYISEDFYSRLELYRYVKKFIVIDEPLYYYRHGHESLSSSSRLLDYNLIRKFYKQCMCLCKKNNYNLTVMNNISRPYLSFTITCLKLKARQKKNIMTKRTELNEVLKDTQLHEVLKQHNLNNENKAKQILYRAILANNYFLARLLIYIQAYRSKR
mgnify:CR=1 FL=1